jgi:hypothetical protein
LTPEPCVRTRGTERRKEHRTAPRQRERHRAGSREPAGSASRHGCATAASGVPLPEYGGNRTPEGGSEPAQPNWRSFTGIQRKWNASLRTAGRRAPATSAGMPVPGAERTTPAPTLRGGRHRADRVLMRDCFPSGQPQ